MVEGNQVDQRLIQRATTMSGVQNENRGEKLKNKLKNLRERIDELQPNVRMGSEGQNGIPALKAIRMRQIN